MPGYEVQGFAHDTWSYTDGLHCRTRAIWDPEMLYMAYRRMDAIVPWANKFALVLCVRDYSGAGLIAERLQLSWRIRGRTAWHHEPLQRTADEHVYCGSVTGVAPGQCVEYYFAAASRSARHESLPRTAPSGVYTFTTTDQP